MVRQKAFDFAYQNEFCPGKRIGKMASHLKVMAIVSWRKIGKGFLRGGQKIKSIFEKKLKK